MLIRQFYPAEITRDPSATPSWRMRLPIVGLSALVILLGLFPSPWLAIINWIMAWIKTL